MYKLSVPVNINTINDKSIKIYIEELKKARVDRIFLTGGFSAYKKSSLTPEKYNKIEALIKYFKNQGFEIGVWIGGFGHGGVLAHVTDTECYDGLTKILGSNGKTALEAFCPLDEIFSRNFVEIIKKLASFHPDIIMIDDDFRLNTGPVNMGCCCEKHLEKFYKNAGEIIPLEDIERVVFTGGKNKYRTAWLKTMGESLVGFAKMLRKAVDEVDENVRLGSCAIPSTWDYEGTDMITLSKAFAGKTQPFIRTYGAPYHGIHPQNVVEFTRMQSAWCADEDIEIFAEGDVYPRPRYNVPSRLLEIYDMALVSVGATDGILKYMFDYSFNVNYEKGYTSRHIRNENLRRGIADLFNDKEFIGIRVFETMHKVENYDMPNEYDPSGTEFLRWLNLSVSATFLSQNSIPTVYEKSTGYPAIIFGENAKYVNEDDLKNGAILDVIAAKILKERGIDTGIISSTPHKFKSEFFDNENDGYTNISLIETHKAECMAEAVTESWFMPEKVPSAYKYENNSGQKFYVLLSDMYRNDRSNLNYFMSYYRQQHLIDAIEWLCSKPLPAVCAKNPYLYIQTARGKDGSMTVALFNMNLDEIPEPVIILDKEYSEIQFLNCKGYIKGRTVFLYDEIHPYSLAVFEVR